MNFRDLQKIRRTALGTFRIADEWCETDRTAPQDKEARSFDLLTSQRSRAIHMAVTEDSSSAPESP